MSNKKKIILDTGPGSDFDDVYALTLAANSPELELVGVTIVSGKGLLRARIDLKLLRMLGKPDVPVIVGAEEPLLRDPRPWWTTFRPWGHEGKGFLTPEDEKLMPAPGYAPDFIVEKVMEFPGQITLIPVGPMTNIALAIIRNPKIIGEVKEIIAMGGVINARGIGVKPLLEHNFSSDPEATRVVLNSGIPFKMVNLNVTLKFVMSPARFEQIKALGTPVTKALVSMTEIWLKEVKRNWSELHDPLAVGVAIDPSFVKFKKYFIEFGMWEGILETIPFERTEFIPTAAPHIEVAEDVEADRFWDFFVERIGRNP